MRFLPILFLLHLVTGLDLCHDPRTSDLHRSCATPSFALLIPSVHGNPNHALHDTLWAVSHYLRNCVKHPLTLYVPTIQNLRLCEYPDGRSQPDWGFCVAYILAKAVGASVDTRVRVPGSFGKGVCHTTETVLRNTVDGWPESFRGRNWFVDYGEGIGHARLDSAVTAKALRHIRFVVRRFYGVPNGGKGGDEINVLIYDRSDARRRRWDNARDVVNMVKKIPGARVTYITKVPTGLGRQARLFGKADLLIAPHGAAMANTLFMQDGSGVLEITKECSSEWARRRGADWTGWHVQLIGLTLRYVGCKQVTTSTHRVDVREVGQAVLEMMERIKRSKSRREVLEVSKKHAGRKVLMAPAVFASAFALLRMQFVFGKRLRRSKMKGKSGGS